MYQTLAAKSRFDQKNGIQSKIQQSGRSDLPLLATQAPGIEGSLGDCWFHFSQSLRDEDGPVIDLVYL